MAKKEKFPLIRSFVKHFLRGGIKATGDAVEAIKDPTKWVNVVTEILDEMIFEVLDEKSAFEESQKIHEKLDGIIKKQLETAEGQETDFAEVLAGLHLQADFNEKVEAELQKIVNLLKDPDKAEIPEWFGNAVDKLLAKDEELLEVFLEKIGELSEEHKVLGSKSDHIIGNTEQIMTAIETLGKQLDAVNSKGEGKIGEARVFLSKMPITGQDLFGRNKELVMLSRAWVSKKTKIISFVAWGGVGKTALVNEWLNIIGEKNWQGAQRVYGWSFYSQGTTEDRQASSDTFLANALEWFGDKETAESAKSAWDKGVRLAELIREQKTLLILDGVEPLQYPPGPMKGRLKDQGLQSLLRELSRGMNGLCVITTRERIEDIEGQVGRSVKLIELENLSPEAGMRILRKEGVKSGTDKELMQASEEFGGHALALNLLGRYLAKRFGGEIRKRDEVPKLAYEKDKQGKHAQKVMMAYEIWLNKTAELNILYLMGLFDRPAEVGAIKALRKEPAIKGLTEQLQGLSEEDWDFAVENLRDLRLLGRGAESGKLDCHPLVREHFGAKLKNKDLDPRQNTEGATSGDKGAAWKEAHSRLYEYYKGVPKKEKPDTLEEMEPLFRAVYHGCAAGQHQKALDDVYGSRIRRGDKAYSVQQLGAFGSDLGAVACFFDRCWDRPAAGLTDSDKAIVLSEAGFALRALGRLREAVEPMKSAGNVFEKQGKWDTVAASVSNLSQLYLILGEVEKAVEYGRKSVEYADKSRNEFHRMSKRVALADALHQAGEIEQAGRLFEEAEGIQRKRQPEYQHLYSVQGYQYCDLLLAEGKAGEVKDRATQTLEWAKKERGGLLTIANDKLSLGRAWLEELRIEKLEGRNRENCLAEAKRWLDEAVDGLRKAGTQHHIPRGLLARAGLFEFRIKNLEGRDREECLAEAWRDLEEVREIAERGEMKLWLADYHLESSRVCLDEADGSPVADQVSNHSGTGKTEDPSSPKGYAVASRRRKAKEHYEEAKKLIEECGYHRRDKELEELAGRI
ncbi:MAG: NACHT domain-containing protein [Sedimentisphaerales bacterium]